MANRRREMCASSKSEKRRVKPVRAVNHVFMFLPPGKQLHSRTKDNLVFEIMFQMK